MSAADLRRRRYGGCDRATATRTTCERAFEDKMHEVAQVQRQFAERQKTIAKVAVIVIGVGAPAFGYVLATDPASGGITSALALVAVMYLFAGVIWMQAIANAMPILVEYDDDAVYVSKALPICGYPRWRRRVVRSRIRSISMKNRNRFGDKEFEEFLVLLNNVGGNAIVSIVCQEEAEARLVAQKIHQLVPSAELRENSRSIV